MRKFLCVLGLLAVVVVGQDRPNQIKSDDGPRKGPADLRIAIFKKYDHKSLPVKNPSKKIMVTIDVEPIFIRNFDERSQILSLDAYVEMKWKDDYLKWNSESNQGIEKMVVSSNDIWTPDITVSTSTEGHLNELEKTNVIIHESGEILWASEVTISTFCPMNLTQYPEDVQICPLQFRSQSYNKNSLGFSAKTKTSNSSQFQDRHAGWTLMSVTDHETEINFTENLFSCVKFDVELKRKMPIAIDIVNKLSYCAVFMVLLMFCLPPDSLHKILVGSLSEILLTIQVFYLGRSLPSDEAVKIATCHLYLLMCFVAVSMGAEVLVISMARMLVHCRPSRCLMGIAKCCCQPFCICASRAYRSSYDPRTVMHNEKSKKPTAQDEWNVIATAFDRLLLMAAVIVIVFIYKFHWFP